MTTPTRLSRPTRAAMDGQRATWGAGGVNGFEARGDWPEASIPIYKAVFEQLRTPEQPHPRSMVSWLAPWQWSAAGERVGAGPLDTDGYILAEADIDLDAGRFCYRWKPRSGPKAQIDDARIGFSLTPHEIPDFLDDSNGLLEALGLSDEGREAIRGRSEGLWHILSSALFASIAITDEAKAWARIHSPLAPDISAIPADAWPHFEVENWARGVAVCHETGDRLFSLRVEFLTPGGTAASLDHAEALMQEIERLRRAGESPMTIEDMVSWAAANGLPRSWVRAFRVEKLPDDETVRRKPGRPRGRSKK